MAEERVLEMTVIGASNLKDVNILSKMETFAVVRLAPYVEYTTDVDSKNGVNPRWNEKFGFLVPEQLLQRGDAKIKVEIYTLSTLGQKFVSEASIPVSDISTTSSFQTQHRRYPLKTASGDFQGELNVAFNLQDKVLLPNSSEDYPIMRPPITKPPQDFDYDYPVKPSKTRPYDSESGYEPTKPTKTQPPRTQAPYDGIRGQRIGGDYVDQVDAYTKPQITPPTYQAPQPTSQMPYPSSQTPHLTSHTPYPSSQASYPTSHTPYSSSQTTHPTSHTPYSSSQTTHPTSQTPYPSSQTPYPISQAPYPSSQAPYPTSQAPYPSSQTPYPTPQTTYPSSHTPYPTSQTPYPTSQTPYPTSQTTYPSSQTSYPSLGGHLPHNAPLGNIFSTPIGKVLLSDLSKSTIPHEPTFY